MLRIDTIILSVRPNESNVQNSIIVICMHYEPVLFACNIEHNTITFDKTGMLVSDSDVIRAVPVGLCRFPIPGLKRMLGWSMLLTKHLEGAPRDNSHRGTVSCSHFGSNDRMCGFVIDLRHGARPTTCDGLLRAPGNDRNAFLSIDTHYKCV
jgi:hypothetical protein